MALMFDSWFLDMLLLLGCTVGVVFLFQRLHIPSSLAYLLVGVLLGPHTAGPVIDQQHIKSAAEFGIVFLLFTIGLSFSLSQLHALRHLVLGLGTAQVALTTAVIGIAAWLAGSPPAAAFVVGAVFAQSSTTVISQQLSEQGEEHSRHGRLGIALSVFQDVTTVPLVVAIPVLGQALELGLVESLTGALGRAVLAFALLFGAGRWLLRPLFHAVAARHSAELFTLTVLLTCLGAASLTHLLGLSMPFGAFLAGMMLSETEFRHQMEATIRPFRDVLLGLFFVGIGMLLDPSAIPSIWHWAAVGALALLGVKVLLVGVLGRWAGIDALTAWRVGLLVAVGGEFGFALLALALGAGIIAERPAQIVLTAVLFSMIVAPLLISFNRIIAGVLVGERRSVRAEMNSAVPFDEVGETLRDHAIICGYGRIGQSVGHLLEKERIAYVALDLDPSRVREARIAGEPVYYGDSAQRDMLEAVGMRTARLVVVSYDDLAAARAVLAHVRTLRPELPVMVRTRDEAHVDDLRQAGATEVVPETLEAGLMIASQALLLLDVPLSRVMRRVREQRQERYLLLREFFRGDSLFADEPDAAGADRLRPVLVPADGGAVGRTLSDLGLDGVVSAALVRQGARVLAPPPDTRLEAGDVIVLFGPPGDLQNAEARLVG